MRNKKGIGSHHSKRMGHDEWLTPPYILKALGDFDLDPCSPIKRPWPTAAQHFTKLDDGLSQPWCGRAFVNPPYGLKIGDWLSRCAEHGNVTALIFARTETHAWVKHVWGKAHSILFLWGRVFFHRVDGERAKVNSGAPSALISYNTANTRALERSKIPGYLVRLK